MRFDKITLMTIHAAKGTEFPVVIVAGMENGTFPISRRHRSLAEIEEERGVVLCWNDTCQRTAVSHLSFPLPRESRVFGFKGYSRNPRGPNSPMVTPFWKAVDYMQTNPSTEYNIVSLILVAGFFNQLFSGEKRHD